MKMPGNFLSFFRPELLVLVPALIALGLFLRRSSHQNRYIPVFLGVIAILTSLLYLMATGAPLGAEMALTGACQGFLAAALAVYLVLLAKAVRAFKKGPAAPCEKCEECDCDDCMWFKVQICASKSQSTAEDLAVRLRKDGYNAYVVADRQA